MKKLVIAYLHTHWDREWYREFEIFRLRLIKVFDNVLNLLEKGKIPSFYFDGQVVALLDYLEIRPEKEPLIRKLIAEKKLFIGPFYCLIDEFLTDKTTFKKNLEIGLKISKDFGCSDFIGYFADTFGHSKNIPPILKEFGIDKAMVWRGVPDLPSEFIFNGVNTVNMVRGYFMDIFSNQVSIEEKAKKLKENLDKIAEKSGDVILLPIGADHLGIEPDIVDQIKKINKLLKKTNKNENEYEIKLSTPFEYFDLTFGKYGNNNADAYDVWNEELRDNSKTFILQGAYSARMRLKQYRTEAAYRLEQADKFQKIYGNNYKKIIEYAYKLLLQNQAHDSICGCSTDITHLECYMRYEKVLQIADTVIEEIKFENPKAFETLKNSGYEFKSLTPLEGYDIVQKGIGFDTNILFDTQKIPVTEDVREIYTLKKHQPPTLEVNMEITEKALKINDIEVQFVRYKDNGDTYNFGAVENDMGETAIIYDVLRNEQLDSFCIRTNFFDVFLFKQANLINFKIEWNNQQPNSICQVKFNLPKPVTKTYSEDLNTVIEREFEPNYNMRDNLPKERGIEVKTNFAPMQRYVGAQGFGVITKGLNEYEVKDNSILITLLRSTGIISNPKNPARSTPAGPPINVPDAQQIGYNNAEFSIGFFEPKDYLEHVEMVYPEITKFRYFTDFNN